MVVFGLGGFGGAPWRDSYEDLSDVPSDPVQRGKDKQTEVNGDRIKRREQTTITLREGTETLQLAYRAARQANLFVRPASNILRYRLMT
jgi:hypothetical protein